MVLSKKTAIAAAVFASCVLHLAIFWFFNAAGSGTRGGKVSLRGNDMQTQTVHLSVAPEQAAPSVEQPSTPTPTPPSASASAVQDESPPASTKAEEAATARGLDLGGYWPTFLLDTEPVVIEDIPDDPPELQSRTETGTMVLTLLIGANGTVDEVIVESSDLPDIFAEVTRRNFLNTRFSPGVRNSLAVPSTMRIEVVVGAQASGSPLLLPLPLPQ